MAAGTQRLHPDTRVIHASFDPDPETGATAAAIVPSSAFAAGSAEELEAIFAGTAGGYLYSRLGNPTVCQFERRMAALEDGRGAVATASGMAAISATVLALAGAGDEVLAGSHVFSGTRSLLSRTLARHGIATRYFDARDAAACGRAIHDRTRLVLVESIGNPALDVPDLAALSAVCRSHGVALAVDNTLGTPLLIRPGDRGADIILHSASKFINGHGMAIGGVIVDAGTSDWSCGRYRHLTNGSRPHEWAFLAHLRREVCRDLGGCLSPFNAFLMMVGLETLAVRMERHWSNAAHVAEALATHPKVRELRFPGLPAHPDHGLSRRQFGGRFGSLLTVRLGSREGAFRFINGLQLCRNVSNLGDTRTLVIHPASTFCRELTADERAEAGVTDDLVRVSVGIEHPDDILHDLERGLEQV